MAAEKETTTISAYLDETLDIKLTRRELYHLRKYAIKRQESAAQGMNAVFASPAKRSMRQQEYDFYGLLISHLYGDEIDEKAELESYKESVRAAQALSLKEKADRMKRQSEELLAAAQDIINGKEDNA